MPENIKYLRGADGALSVTDKRDYEKQPAAPKPKSTVVIKRQDYDWYTDAFRRFSISKLRSDEQLKNRNVGQHALSITLH